MMSLTHGQMARLLTFVDQAIEVESFLQISSVLLPSLACLMGAALVKFHYIYRTDEPFSIDVGWPAELFTVPNMAAFAQVAHLHPLPRSLGMVLARAPEQPLAVSDLLTRRAWRSSQVYREAMQAVGGDDQMAMILGVSSDTVGLVTLTRCGPPFTDEDHRLLFRARGHIGAAVCRAVRTGVTGAAMQTRPVARWVDLSELVPEPSPANLSRRELEVLVLVAEGMTNVQIGRRMSISPRTVTKHVEHIYRKVGVESRAAATRFLLTSGGDPATAKGPEPRRHWVDSARLNLSQRLS